MPLAAAATSRVIPYHAKTDLSGINVRTHLWKHETGCSLRLQTGQSNC